MSERPHPAPSVPPQSVPPRSALPRSALPRSDLPLSATDTDLQAAWRVFIETAARLQTELDDDLRAKAGMTLADYSVLLILHESPDGRLRMRDLAARMIFSTSRLSYQVDGMCRRGWLCRERATEDRRGSYAVLTDEGRAVFRSAAADHARCVDDLFFSALTPADGRDLRAVMAKLAAHLAERDAQAAETRSS
ncbi:MarR family winged helix-turn-helix transcriptional regulator [Gordonia aurantiaca]|uniref:MarR family winged helix-turn-helix transcriptional regulator n=1 Tax=Gordonia sp. B21 TaxID=3151852 RepID=UPI0032640AC7